MNRSIRRIAVAFMVLFLALLANANYIQVFQASDLNDRSDNKRVTLDEYARERGPIMVGGTQVAYSVKTKDDLVYLRRYRDPQLYGHLTGYYSYVLGRRGLEKAENSVLSGTDDRLFVRRIVDLITNRQPQGGSVLLTINPKAQQAAYDALGNKRGAVVAIEPSTGKILAMVSKPTYDPNRLSSHDANSILKAANELQDDPSRPMENRAAQRRYPPGSTFKLVTAAAALSSGRYNPNSQLPAPAELDLPLTTFNMKNWQNGLCGPAPQVTLTQALATSCNTAFGGLGLKVGEKALRQQAEKFGFGQEYLPDLGASTSVFPREVNPPQLAQSSIGQFDVAATPLQMAMVSAGIANGGKVMQPYVVAKVSGPDLKTLEVTEPRTLSQAVSGDVAQQLTQMMVDVVDHGTGQPVKIDGVSVAGKTGTAQTTPDKPPYAWFTSFAPANAPQVAVAVVIEHADVGRNEISGGRLAAPVAKAVMRAVIGR
ncbi:peptidoglycan D,D-transpeptidase FtsI family protein [Actinopolymorpha singaporensis]|uniref:Cell elongation-specific peptidoglycan D,D-transpeptidase n=1 Tax=Actinopolymorpha singaporensis TaxID=117157 RepID=A0A1H1N9Y6_9ACTN|nr:penicillin-binding transpeptidase domain-containing protein [Actinopolymorpha singaporensis]SDR95784.1 cell elongation-specific peptidoglycan D,D-transpeptidase [Actinopolymorpha singaporensis]